MDDAIPDNAHEAVVELHRFCRQKLKNLHKKREKQALEYTEASSWTTFSQIADSLLANPDAFPRGTVADFIHNVHTDTDEEIKLNPRLDACQNAELLYKKSRKGKRGAEIAETNLRETDTQIRNLMTYCDACDALKTGTLTEEEFAKAVDTLMAKAAADGLIVHPPKLNRIEQAVADIPYRHYTIDEYDIYVGKNDAQNDEMTQHFAKPSDIWMHVTPHAGSHVIIRRHKDQPLPPKEILAKAASLAAWFSKAKHATSADVHITEARFVRKPRKFPPGKVIAERCTNLHVKPISPQEMFRGLPHEKDE
jgi:predicted ribosome quality control (RQC) complex YloA/Tae2 family protein